MMSQHDRSDLARSMVSIQEAIDRAISAKARGEEMMGLLALGMSTLLLAGADQLGGPRSVDDKAQLKLFQGDEPI